MIKVYNRKTGEYENEKVAAGRLIELLYSPGIGRLGLELLVKRKICSDLSGFFFDSGFSKGKIRDFIDRYGIDMSLCRNDIGDFKSFNDFFTRKLKPEARIFNPEPGLLLSPGDGRIRAWEDIDINKVIQVKGLTYSLKELLVDENLAGKYKKGLCILLRLAPVDYHRFHFIDSGTCTSSKRIKGCYYSVNPAALEAIPQVFCRNKREYSTLHSENFGDILYVEVGATSVGSIIQTYSAGAPLSRGDEKGYFKFGGSTVILFLEKGKAHIDSDILQQTEIGYETKVLAGEVIGRRA